MFNLIKRYFENRKTKKEIFRLELMNHLVTADILVIYRNPNRSEFHLKYLIELNDLLNRNQSKLTKLKLELR